MNDFKEKFQHLNFNQQPTNHTDDNINTQIKNDNKNNKTSYAMFKELLRRIFNNTQQDKIFILLLELYF